MDSKLPCVCSVIDHRRRQNVVRTALTHSPNGLCATYLLLPQFEVICNLLLNRCTSTWNPSVNQSSHPKVDNLPRNKDDLPEEMMIRPASAKSKRTTIGYLK